MQQPLSKITMTAIHSLNLIVPCILCSSYICFSTVAFYLEIYIIFLSFSILFLILIILILIVCYCLKKRLYYLHIIFIKYIFSVSFIILYVLKLLYKNLLFFFVITQKCSVKFCYNTQSLKNWMDNRRTYYLSTRFPLPTLLMQDST